METLLKQPNKLPINSKIKSSKILRIGGEYTPGQVKVVIQYDGIPIVNYPNLPEGFQSGWSVKLHNYIYCLGGEIKNTFTNQWESTNRVIRLGENTKRAVFEDVLAMNYKRSEFSAAVLSDTIVVTGGIDSDNKLVNFPESYSPKLNEWKEISQPKKTKRYHVLVSCNGCLFNIGGLDGYNFLPTSSVERLKGLKEDWVVVAAMNEKRAGLAAASCNNCVYAIGGRTSHFLSSRTNTVEKYDSASNKWSYVKSMKFCRSGHEACEMNGKIYVIGGGDAH